MTEGGDRGDDPNDHLLEILGGKHRAQALSTAAALGIADRLVADGARDSATLARETGCGDVAALDSLLRLLAGLGFLSEPTPGCFAITELGLTDLPFIDYAR